MVILIMTSLLFIFEGNSYTMPFSSRSMERGKLLSEEYYDVNDRLRKKVNYRYKEVTPGSFVTADQMVLFFCTDLDNFMLGKVGTLTRTYTHAYLTDSVIETLYPQSGNTAFVIEKAYQYNKYKQLSQIAGRQRWKKYSDRICLCCNFTGI